MLETPPPWSIPVPLQASRFVPLDQTHQNFNVETDLKQLSGFGFTRVGSHPMLGFADLQVGGIEHKRLGSGRSCHFQGKYIKGIGRTQLAGNWADARDIYHHSGHLLASGAVREYVVSRYFEARGISDAIIPCEGLLLAPLSENLYDFHRQAFPEYHTAGARPLPIDLALQGLTVKPGGFVRYSNLSWLLNAWGSGTATSVFFRHLAKQLVSAPNDIEELDPYALVRLLQQAVGRGIHNFETYFACGVFWGSFYNNFTLDGRFIDLEIPLIFGRPFFGLCGEKLPDGASPKVYYVLPGCELFIYLDEVRRFTLHVQHSLRFSIAFGFTTGLAREYAETFMEALNEQFPPTHPVHCEDEALKIVERMIAISLGPSDREIKGLKPLIRRSYEAIQGRVHGAFTPGDPWVSLDIDMARRETMIDTTLFFPKYLPQPDFTPGVRINEFLRELDQKTDLALVMETLKKTDFRQFISA